MMRPLNVKHTAILAAIAERGPLGAPDLEGHGVAASNYMRTLCGLGYIVRHSRVERPSRLPCWRYDLTEEGRAALDLGQVIDRRERSRSTFNGRQDFPHTVALLNGCCHHWTLDAQSQGRCVKCGAMRAFPTVLSLLAMEMAAGTATKRVVVACGEGSGSDYGNQRLAATGASVARLKAGITRAHETHPSTVEGAFA